MTHDSARDDRPTNDPAQDHPATVAPAIVAPGGGAPAGDGRDEVWRRDEIDSPCVKVCVIHAATGLCVGCLRTLDEISRWSRMGAAARAAVMAALPGRQGRLAVRRGGRAGRLAE